MTFVLLFYLTQNVLNQSMFVLLAIRGLLVQVRNKTICQIMAFLSRIFPFGSSPIKYDRKNLFIDRMISHASVSTSVTYICPLRVLEVSVGKITLENVPGVCAIRMSWSEIYVYRKTVNGLCWCFTWLGPPLGLSGILYIFSHFLMYVFSLEWWLQDDG